MRQITVTLTAMVQDEPLGAETGYEGQQVTDGFITDYLVNAGEYMVPGVTITQADVTEKTAA